MRRSLRNLLICVGLAVCAPAWSNDLAPLRARAVGGDAEAAYRLGRAYKTGDGVGADNREAERWFAKAASLGFAKGEDEFGLVLLQNDKPREALPWIRKAAERGDARAQYALATLFFNGTELPRDVGQARLWMSRAAKTGLPAATEALSIMAGASTPQPGEKEQRTYRTMTVQQPMAAPPAPGRWRVQLGAFRQAGNAARLGKAIGRSQGKLLDVSYPSSDGITRLQVGPFASRDQAEHFCRLQQKSGRDCLTLAPVNVRNRTGTTSRFQR